ncbi:hypothetical protein PV325_007448 [Microctonus aethiopoides]|uniref:Uncharacterized protein n=1 Tax=Microctonus aethiopoides TaxID=144406 RepID=A0AA39FWP9_9HYME|nr:hypothetical protein PV325_007448 [Microctonus aethiopoides]KAK0093469.1 hypothetical protein PV326_013457 [Microctonus aethiopoides]KAK0177255.1 hypothetical protein PV328_001327 [Microctonus aethiopoides]
MYGFKIIIILVGFLNISSSEICKICSCAKSDGVIVYDCDKKFESNVNNFSVLLYLNDDYSPEKFILSNNGFTESLLEPLKDLQSLRQLDLSHNFLNGSNIKIFEYMTKLYELNLSFNQWTTFNTELFINLSSLSKLDISHNFIVNFNLANFSKQFQLTHLYLSHNKITIINEQLLDNFPLLQYIDLAFNSISSIEFHAFTKLHSLNTLMLQHNFMKSLDVNFPQSLKTLAIDHNNLTQFPSNLSVDSLSINNNEISLISINNKNILKQLKFLNISRNMLNIFIDDKFSSLEILDISYNKFSSIPETIIARNFPKLDTLVISGNPISQLKFNAEIKLRSFVVRNLSLLTSVNDDAFKFLKEYDNDCINLTISSNEKLELFDEKSVDNLNLCYMDLSNNELKKISPHMKGLQDHFFFKYGLNLQGNPLVCDCASQWMLNDFVPKLYELNSELLIDLRCNEPPELSNVRLVHWYKWKNQIFCDDNRSMNINNMENNSTNIYMESMSSTIVIESSKTMLFAVVSCTAIFAVIVIGGLIYSLKLEYKKRRKNRRF